MKNYRIYVSLFILLSILFFQSCGKQESENIDEQKILNQDTIAVKISKVEYRDIEISKTYSATLEGEEQANIVAKISERIIKINARVGDFVQKGNIIVELDKIGGTSQFYQAEAGYLNAKKDFERMQALYSEGAISQQMLDGTETAFNIAQANYEAAKSLVELTSPISGVITEINTETGDLTTPGMQIIKIAKINRLKAIFNVGEQDIMSVGVGQPIEVYSELQPDLVMQGRINQISKSADIQSRTFEIKGLFNNTRDKWFKPGMFCRVKLILKNKKGSLTVPSVALLVNGNEKGVYIINNGKAYYKNVTAGISNDNYTEITQGLNEQDNVVVLGMNSLKEGIPVHISD
jgi:membrane fusion protein (multidrug efflux system)